MAKKKSQSQKSQEARREAANELLGLICSGEESSTIINKVCKLLESGADLTCKLGYGQTLLHLAAKYDRPVIARLLLKHGADVNARDEGLGWTPLQEAAYGCNPHMCALLIGCGADVNMRPTFPPSNTIFDIARGGHDVYRLLIENGADVSNLDLFPDCDLDKTIKAVLAEMEHDGWQFPKNAPAIPPAWFMPIRAPEKESSTFRVDQNLFLIDGAERGNIEKVRKALENGADVHVTVDVALRSAAAHGYTEIVALLLEKGADVHACNGEALRWAASNGHTETAALLKDWIAGKRPETPEDVAARQERDNTRLEELKAAKIRARELGFIRPTDLGRTPGGRG